MTTVLKQLYNDEAGFIVSAELVLVSSIGILSMMVGLSEVSMNVNCELEDVGSAFGAINQSFWYSMPHGLKGCMTGSSFSDDCDWGDSQYDITCNAFPRGEACATNCVNW
jgi:hypothetical protein